MAKNKFKVVIGYPPIEQEKGVPLLSQNRQFQYFNSPTYIYPMVPAYAATVAKKAGYKVRWMDGIAENKIPAPWFCEVYEGGNVRFHHRGNLTSNPADKICS